MIRGPNVLARQDLVEPRLLDVQELAAQREDGLEAAVAALLRRTSGRIALHDVQLAASGVALLTVGKLAGQGHPVQRPLPDHEVAGLACRLAGPGGGQALLDDPPTVRRVLVEVLAEAVRDRGLDLALDLGIAQLRLGLAFELRVGQLHADDCGQAFADVVARQVRVAVLEDAGAPSPVVERARECRTEAGHVAPAIGRVDVVGEGEHVFGVRLVVLERDLDRGGALLALDVDRAAVQGFLVPVQVAHERLEATLEVEGPFTIDPLVDQGDPDALGEVGGLAQPLADRLERVFDRLEHLGVGAEARGRAVASSLRADLLDGRAGLAALVFLRPDAAVAGGFDAQP